MIPLEFAYGIGAGLGAAAGLYLLLWWRARRIALGSPPPDGAVQDRLVFTGLPNGAGSHASGALSTSPEHRTPERERPPSTANSYDPPLRLPVGPMPEGPVVASSESRRSLPPPETLRLSQRVILHVYGQGHLPPGEVAPPGLCQAGIVEALGIPQAGLAAVLRRLEAAGVLTTERGHVRGHDRRLKIYRLSSRGVEVAKELRARRPPPSGR
ncbi:MAG: hypothetical protein L3K23_06280 [Thermoplasmata archaeon]|nr:hypothetical protein [Thermoplasmata archaeon]